MWYKFSKKKPSKDGWYLCTVEVPEQQRYVMELYWNASKKKFLNNIRQNVFDTYDVYAFNGEKIYTDPTCDRTEGVIAWRKEYRPYMKGFKKEKRI